MVSVLVAGFNGGQARDSRDDRNSVALLSRGIEDRVVTSDLYPRI
jgi:hypothetical protein